VLSSRLMAAYAHSQDTHDMWRGNHCRQGQDWA
jgi:hypothetical protein